MKKGKLSRMTRTPKRDKQALTAGPLFGKGKKKTAGHDMGDTFARSMKKPESDMPPRTRGSERSARRMRLTNKFI